MIYIINIMINVWLILDPLVYPLTSG